MKYLPEFNSLLRCSNEDKVWQYLTHNLTDSIKLWDYFVNWDKVSTNTQAIKVELNLLNSLIGEENIEDAFKNLATRYPRIISLFPLLLACRETQFEILIDESELEFQVFDFGNPTSQQINEACLFAKKSGVLDLLANRKIRSIPDYVFGVEVGLDSNGRKNRTGTAMEQIVEKLLTNLCKTNGYQFMAQATAQKVHLQWGFTLDEYSDKREERRYDFAVNVNGKLSLLETNFYGVKGSKLKATAGEYTELSAFVKKQGYGFIWITDGAGWHKTLRPLEDAFKRIDFVLNLRMVKAGILGAALLSLD